VSHRSTVNDRAWLAMLDEIRSALVGPLEVSLAQQEAERMLARAHQQAEAAVLNHRRVHAAEAQAARISAEAAAYTEQRRRVVSAQVAPGLTTLAGYLARVQRRLDRMLVEWGEEETEAVR